MPGCVFIRDVQQATTRIPKIVVKRVVHDHSDEATHDDRRIDVDERAFALTLADVAAEEFVNAPHKLVEEHLRELVFFERRMQQQTLKIGIVFVVRESSEGERFENGAIVFAPDAFGGHFFRFKRFAAAARFVVENGGVEFLFGGEMAENHCLGNPRCVCNFFGGSAAKPPVGEETDGNREYL